MVDVLFLLLLLLLRGWGEMLGCVGWGRQAEGMVGMVFLGCLS